MTDARLGGLGREALVAESGELRSGGIVREALIAGIGLSGRVASRASGRAAATVVFAGVILHGTATARSRTRGAVSIRVNLAVRAKSISEARANLPSTILLAGRVGTRSRASLARVDARVITGRATARSLGAAALHVYVPGSSRQYAVTVT